jgi:hypothetical protein
MWYHYIVLVIALYLVGSSIYNIVMSGNQAGWIVNGITTAIGGGLALFAWNGINAPAPMLSAPLLSSGTPMFGGRRHRR